MIGAGHTPGPWQWNDAGRLLHNVPASHSSTVLVVHDPVWRPTEADARLIASAPELLETLEKAAVWFRDYEGQHRAKMTQVGDLKADVNGDRAAFLEAVIARAKGAA